MEATHPTKKKYAIIVAGGVGKRMNDEVPKQFLPINGVPLLIYTLKAFYDAIPDTEMILVLPEDHMDLWEKLCYENDFVKRHKIVPGGDSRFESVKNGLAQVTEDGLVALHDGVRPLIKKEIIINCFKVCEEKGNAVVAVGAKDSIRIVISGENKAVDRKEYYLVQTPQCFTSDILKKAYEQPYNKSFTDDATVVENLGEQIHLIEGDYQNIKITFREDLKFAASYLG